MGFDLAAVRRGLLSVVLTAAAGCAADPSGGAPPPPASSQPAELAVHVSIAPEGLGIVSVTPSARTEPPASFVGAAIAYTFTDTHGAIVQSGRVADPRPVHAELFAGGAGQRVEGQQTYASIMFHLTTRRGTLTLTEDGPSGAMLGSVDVVPPTNAGPPGTTAESLVNTATDIVGSPVEVVAHGSAANSFDLLLLPEGYTADQLVQFASDVNRVVAELSTRPDYARHWSQINVWRIDVRSNDTGVSPAAPAPLLNTAFDLRRDPTTDRLLVFGDTSGPAAATELGARVQADAIVIVANTTYGGSGGTQTVAGNDASLPQVVAHELGHSLASLADEYAIGYDDATCQMHTTFFGSASVNVSATSDRASLPWADLVDASTPVPTPDGMTAIGAYQGGGYCADHRWRPTPDCLMRELTQQFCPVCQRAMDAYFARYPGGGSTASDSTGGTSSDAGTTSSAPSDAGTGSGAGSTCAYACASQGYAAGQCVSGWYCDGTCITFTGCTASSGGAPPPSDSTSDAGASRGDDASAPSDAGATCGYFCDAYGYAAGQCVSGWYCDGTCLVNNGCADSSGAGSGADAGGVTDDAGATCDYSCDAYGYTDGQCVSGWYCDGDCLVDNGCTG